MPGHEPFQCRHEALVHWFVSVWKLPVCLHRCAVGWLRSQPAQNSEQTVALLMAGLRCTHDTCTRAATLGGRRCNAAE